MCGVAIETDGWVKHYGMADCRSSTVDLVCCVTLG